MLNSNERMGFIIEYMSSYDEKIKMANKNGLFDTAKMFELFAIEVCNAFINAGLPAFTGSYADWAQTLIYLCEMTFTIAMTVGSVKGAQTLTSKAFGL